MSYNVLIVEDQSMPRQLLEIFVNNSRNFTLIGSLSNADTAVKFCKNKNVDLVLMDVLTDLGSNGLDASQIIKRDFPQIKIIILTSMPEATWLKRARKIGIDSFWYKESEEIDILSVMEKTMLGEHIYPDDTPTVKIGVAKNHDFTDREIDVLRELVSGDSNTVIAKNLGISVDTVKFHIKSMLQKTGFHTRTELATQARGLGIVIK